jgi:hypothetical protein
MNASELHQVLRDERFSEPILTDDVIGAWRLPFPMKIMKALFRAAPEGALCKQVGEWFLILKPKEETK